MDDMLPPTPLYLPYSLPFPITLQRLTAPTSSNILKSAPLFTYSYHATLDGIRERQVSSWHSPVQGQIVNWAVKEGQLISDASQPVVHIREPCTHDVQLHGLCALCGKDLTVIDYTGFSDTTRAAISMVHDVGGLTVSLEEAHRLEAATTTRLLSEKKLSLIVDLDQTIVHATVDPTVGEWLGDQSNPNYKALEGVKRFKLGTDTEVERDDGCWYYVKMRPGLPQFLEDVAKIYEMHVYTMGTRAYAIEVCKVIDPEGRLFGGRILSRDESGSMTRKSLQRLFPCDTNMVVIIDDRADVWDGSPNLVKVIPYEFFVGIGDINAAFLPKKKELTATPAGSKKKEGKKVESKPAAVVEAEQQESGSTTPETTVEDLLVSPLDPRPDFPSLLNAETSTALAIHDQIESRPLKKASEQAQHPSASTSTSPSEVAESEAGTEVGEEVQQEEEEEAVLKDDDVELGRLFGILKDVRDQFYDEVGKGSKSADVKTIIPNMKRQVLSGLHLVFSGLVALGTRPHDSEYWKLATTFGAQCSADLTRQTTHVVAKENGTAKVHHARRSSLTSPAPIHIVWAQWLLDCAAQWRRLNEEEGGYLIPPDPPAPTGEGAGVRSTTPPLPPPPEEKEQVQEGEGEGEEEEDLALDEFDWGDAAKEVDDFLNETDEEGSMKGDGEETEDDEESDSGSVASGSGSGRPRKRARGEDVDSEDDAKAASAAVGTAASNGLGSAAGKGKGKERAKEEEKVVAVGSPLQKRVKTSRARKSKLKVSFPAAALEDNESSQEQELPAVASAAVVVAAGRLNDSAPPSPALPPTSQASSAVDSDDEAFFASMAAEVEKGWS